MIQTVTKSGLQDTVNYVNSINMYVSQPQHIYEVLDYISTSQQQYFDTDIVAQNGIKVEMTTKLTSRPGNTRLWSTHDPTDYSGQNWAFASGTWGLQFEGSQMCIKPLGTSSNNINSFDLLSYYYNDVQNKKLRYELACSGLLEIYDDTDTLVYTFDSSAKTDLNKVSQTTIRFFGREATERGEWMVGDTYDIKIYDNGTLIRHYIPVKRISDNVIGFYETETETFLTSASGTIFSGTSKSTPEYIDETVSQTININKIYLNGEVYWGNEPTSTPPTPTKTNTVKGKGAPNTVYNDALRINRQDYAVTTDADGNFTLQLDAPVYDITGGTGDIFYNTSPTTISELDLRDLVYDNENGVDLRLFTNTRYIKAALTDIWFDFTDLTNITKFSFNCRTNITNDFHIHGLGTLNVTFPQAPDANTIPEDWTLREGSSVGYWKGTLDIRGIDTRNAIDWPRVGSYPPDYMYGAFYNWPGSNCYCDTLIIGNLEWPYDYFTGWNIFNTLYCTSTTPPSLDRTGQYGITAKNYISAMNSLTTIYVPTGCLSAYQNASVWSNYANKMSELDAPDPLTI